MLFEVSGGINLERVEKLVKMGIDAFSTSKIVTAARWPDISLEFTEVKSWSDDDSGDD